VCFFYLSNIRRGQCLDGCPPEKPLQYFILNRRINDMKKLLLGNNYHFLIEISVMINKCGLDAVRPFYDNNDRFKMKSFFSCPQLGLNPDLHKQISLPARRIRWPFVSTQNN
jgi:hypothetical protein